MSPLLRRLQEDHENMSRLLDLLDRELERLRRLDSDVDHRLLCDIAHYFTAFPDAVHHPLEEELFALLRDKQPELAGRLAALHQDHVDLAAIGRDFHELMLSVCNGQPVRRDRLLAQGEQFLERQRRHMEAEGQGVFQRAPEALSEPELAALERRRSGADPLFGEQLREEYARLREAISSSQ